MSDLYFVGSGPVNLGAATQLCVLALNTPSAPRIKLSKISVSFNGATSTNTPVNCQIAKISNTPSGTAIPSHYGPNAIDWDAPASLLTSAATASTATPGVWTTAPTGTSIVWEIEIPPTSGLPEWFPLGYEIVPSVSSWIGVFLNAPQAVVAYTNLLYSELCGGLGGVAAAAPQAPALLALAAAVRRDVDVVPGHLVAPLAHLKTRLPQPEFVAGGAPPHPVRRDLRVLGRVLVAVRAVGSRGGRLGVLDLRTRLHARLASSPSASADIGVLLVIRVPLRAVRLGRRPVRPVAHRVPKVRRPGIPAEIPHGVILGIAVTVTAFHSGRARAGKGLENQMVNFLGSLGRPVGQADYQMA
jgi:hypothetical protein